MIRIISLTTAGLVLAQQLKSQLNDGCIWHKPKPFTYSIQQAFQQGDRLIMISAIGIVVRTLAPVLSNKHQDPPVLVLDEQGQFVIPLLSGHEGGANQWANEIAKLLAVQPIITTAKPYFQTNDITPTYSVGMGCERGCSCKHLAELLKQCLIKANLTINQINNLNSIALKSNETGLIQLAKQINKPYFTWDSNTLQLVEPQLYHRSHYIFKVTGVYGVAESAALWGAQMRTPKTAHLVLTKQKTNKATCAIAKV